MTRDEVVALARESGAFFSTPYDAVGLARFAAAIEASVRQDDPALRLVADIRFALGDDGKRMSDELMKYCKELRQDAERYRWLKNALYMGEVGVHESYIVMKDVGSCPTEQQFDAAIAAAMQTKPVL